MEAESDHLAFDLFTMYLAQKLAAKQRNNETTKGRSKSTRQNYEGQSDTKKQRSCTPSHSCAFVSLFSSLQFCFMWKNKRNSLKTVFSYTRGHFCASCDPFPTKALLTFPQEWGKSNFRPVILTLPSRLLGWPYLLGSLHYFRTNFICFQSATKNINEPVKITRTYPRRSNGFDCILINHGMKNDGSDWTRT